jgi:hypothetical protein
MSHLAVTIYGVVAVSFMIFTNARLALTCTHV